MRILFCIQGTGNGHLTRALDIVPALKLRAEVDLLVSGCQVDLSLPWPVKYRLKGMSFIFGKNGGVDFMRTFTQINSRNFYREMSELPVLDYDLVISDFEPVSSWACYRNGKACIGLSNQVAVLSPNAPKAKNEDIVGKFILKNYAPTSSQYGFHFANFDKHTYTPIIRKQVRQLERTNLGHYTVYLPAYEDEKIVKRLKAIPEVEWQVFSKHNRKPFRTNNVKIMPVQNDAFLNSMASSEGVLCAAGFGTPSEVLYLGKKLMVIPMKNQYEQACNAAALNSLGMPSVKSLKEKHLPAIRKWVEKGKTIEVDYPDQTQEIIDFILRKHLLPQKINF